MPNISEERIVSDLIENVEYVPPGMCFVQYDTSTTLYLLQIQKRNKLVRTVRIRSGGKECRKKEIGSCGPTDGEG